MKPIGFIPFECIDERDDVSSIWRNSLYPHITAASLFIDKRRKFTGCVPVKNCAEAFLVPHQLLAIVNGESTVNVFHRTIERMAITCKFFVLRSI